VEAVGKAPGEIGGEGFEPRIAQHIEQRGHDHFDSGAGLVGIGHEADFRLVNDGQLGTFVVLDEGMRVSRGLVGRPGFLGDEAREIGEVREGLHGLSSCVSSSA
jgi:hypothetical protein